jgi:hypothetical protein
MLKLEILDVFFLIIDYDCGDLVFLFWFQEGHVVESPTAIKYQFKRTKKHGKGTDEGIHVCSFTKHFFASYPFFKFVLHYKKCLQFLKIVAIYYS